VVDPTLIGVTDGLVDAVDTIAATFWMMTLPLASTPLTSNWTCVAASPYLFSIMPLRIGVPCRSLCCQVMSQYRYYPRVSG
jgi:hypothetical protein